MSTLKISCGAAEAKSGILLSAGILAGCGAPGADVMIWQVAGKKGFKYYESSRLAAAMNFAGAGRVAIKGKSEEPVVIYISEGKAAAEPFCGSSKELRDYYVTDNTVVLSVEDCGLMDDAGNICGEEEIAAKLKSMNICGIAAEGSGAVVPADAKLLKKTITGMYEALDMACCPEIEPEDEVYLAMGINPKAVCKSRKYKGFVKKLVKAVSGEEAEL